MTERQIRDTRRRNYIKNITEQNLELTKNDPESLFSEKIQENSL